MVAQSQALRRNNCDSNLLPLLAEGEYFCTSVCVYKRERERLRVYKLPAVILLYSSEESS